MPTVEFQPLPTITEHELHLNHPIPRTPYPFDRVTMRGHLGTQTSDSEYDPMLENVVSTTASISSDDSSLNDPEIFALTPSFDPHSSSNDVSQHQLPRYNSPQHGPSNEWGHEHPAGSLAPENLENNVSQPRWIREHRRDQEPCVKWLDDVTYSIRDAGQSMNTLTHTQRVNFSTYATTEGCTLGGNVIPKDCELQEAGILPDPRIEASSGNDGGDAALQMLVSVASMQDSQARSCQDRSDRGRKRDRCDIPAEHRGSPIKRPRLISSPWSIPVSGPVPVSPERCFTEILAEKPTVDGYMYKVVWRESWVHESRLPSIEHLRELHFARNGRYWDVLPQSPTLVRSG